MKLNLRTNGSIKMTDAVKEHINKQIKPLEKIIKNHEGLTLNMLIAEHKKQIKCEVSVYFKHVVLRSESLGDTMYAAIDLACDKIEQQLIRHKGKANDLLKRREGISDFFVSDETEKEEELPIIRTKEVDLLQMTIDEAITQMELLDHEFYMFRSEDNNVPCVVYKRHDGGYGLLKSNE